MSLMQLANVAGALVLTRSDNVATHLSLDRLETTLARLLLRSHPICKECADAQSEREATAAQSGKLQGVIGGITWH